MIEGIPSSSPSHGMGSILNYFELLLLTRFSILPLSLASETPLVLQPTDHFFPHRRMLPVAGVGTSP